MSHHRRKHGIKPPPVHRHRYHAHIIGAIFMTCGSTVAIASAHWDLPHAMHVFVDVIAYAVHGAGAVPYVEPLVKRLHMS